MTGKAYIVMNDGWDEKAAICYPKIVGPFESPEEAQIALDRHPRYNGLILMPMDGGYAGAHIVCDETATPWPGSWAEEEWYED